MAGLLFVSRIDADLPSDPAEYAAWEGRLLAAVEAQREKEADESIPKLGKWVRQLALPFNKEREGRPVYSAAREMLLSIPGHAESYAREINEARERYDAALAEGLPGRAGPALNDLYNIQSAGFGTLRHLPSPETVRVLGEFLYDERGKRTSPRVPGEEERGEFPNCGFAVNALHALPLVNKPVKAERLASGDLETYRLWYEQIKAGNRTFRFEGDPQEYSLDGPVTVAAPVVDARGPRPSEASAAAEAKADETSRLPVTALVLTTLLLAGALTYLIRNRRQNA